MSLNLFKLFSDLLPKYPLFIGDVTAYADGVATITLPDGGVMQARGDTTIGTRVFFQDGVIQGPAPTLTYVELEIT